MHRETLRKYHIPLLTFLLLAIILAFLIMWHVKKKETIERKIARLEQRGAVLDSEINALCMEAEALLHKVYKNMIDREACEKLRAYQAGRKGKKARGAFLKNRPPEPPEKLLLVR